MALFKGSHSITTAFGIRHVPDSRRRMSAQLTIDYNLV